MGKFPTRNEFSITNNVTKCSMLINFDKIYNFLTSILDRIRQPDKEGAHVLLAKAIGIPASWRARRISRTSGKKSNTFPSLSWIPILIRTDLWIPFHVAWLEEWYEYPSRTTTMFLVLATESKPTIHIKDNHSSIKCLLISASKRRKLIHWSE